MTAKGQWKVTYEKETHELKITGSVKRPPAFSGEGTDENPYKVINYTMPNFRYQAEGDTAILQARF